MHLSITLTNFQTCIQELDSRKGETFLDGGGRNTAANKGLSAMLASEYILIDISLISFSPG
jgi:hypothetical protein